AGNRLLDGIEDVIDDQGHPVLEVMMNHGDSVTQLPPGFTRTGVSKEQSCAAIADDERHFYGVQFHPEVTQTKQGARIINRFVRDICGCEALWNPGSIIEDAVAAVRAK